MRIIYKRGNKLRDNIKIDAPTKQEAEESFKKDFPGVEVIKVLD